MNTLAVDVAFRDFPSLSEISNMALPLTLRGSEGLWMLDGPPSLKQNQAFHGEQNDKVRVMTYSRNGAFLAWSNGESVNIVSTSDSQVCQKIDRSSVLQLKLSPLGSILATWEYYAVNRENNQGVHNLHLWNVQTGDLIKSFIQKKQINWAPQWSPDEKLCARNVNNELQFFENGDFDSVHTKLQLQKISEYSLGESGPPYKVAGYVPGTKGQPSFVRIYQYPHFGGPNAALANKSFFKADTVQLKWNKMATALLVVTSFEASDQSYYGEQGLHFVGVNGETCLVPLAKNGPIYGVEWSPKSTEFCVVYGYMPAKATLYSMKVEPIFDFGTGPRNFVFYNPQGNILCLCGFGNLRGNMEFWDVKQKKLINQSQSPDTTIFEWCPDGVHVVTATTAPRLRVGNGYRIWRCTGELLEQVSVPKESQLWEVLWQPVPELADKEAALRYKPAILATQCELPGVTDGVYRPPQARNQQASVKLHEYEAPSNMKQQSQELSKAAIKNKKKRESKKAKAEQEAATAASTGVTNSVASSLEPRVSNVYYAEPSTGDPETDKKIRNLKKKLEQIEKLKEQQKSGKQLEKNQIEKLTTEGQLLKKLEDLEIG